MASNSLLPRKRMAGDFNLADDIWEYVLSKLLNETSKENVEHDRNCYLGTLSLVSKNLLSVTNDLIYSLTISDPSSSPSRIFHRFRNLTSLDLSRFRGDLNLLLLRVSRSCSLSRLTFLNLSNHPTFPASGLRNFVEKTKLPLTSLICSNIGSPLNQTDLLFIADSFPFLQQLDISFPKGITSGGDNDGCNKALQVLTQKLPKLLKVNLSGNFYINNSLLFELCMNCELLEEVVLLECPLLTHDGIASAISQRPSLTSISVNSFMEARDRNKVTSYFIDSLVSLKLLTHLDLSFSCITDQLLFTLADQALPLNNLVLQGCCEYTYTGISYFLSKSQFLQHLDLQNAEFLNDQLFLELCVFLGDLVSINLNHCYLLTNSALFALLRNSPRLSEIRMELTQIGLGSITPVDLVVYHQVKSLHLAYNSHLQDKNINAFSFMFPNMELLDLKSCSGISECIGEVLKRCPKLRHLNLAFCPHVELPWVNFKAPKLEVLNLSLSRIDDVTMRTISRICPRLQQLDLESCYNVTEKGVKLVVENCTHLREINLRQCRKVNVSTNVVAWMIFSRPSLRKITAPPHFRTCDNDKKQLFGQCHVC